MHEKVLWETIEHPMKIIDFKIKKNEVINKRAARIIWKFKNLIFANKTSKIKINIWKIKNMVKLEIIFIIQGNIEMLHIAYVIWNILCLKKFQ